MALKQVLEIYELLDSATVTGSVVGGDTNTWVTVQKVENQALLDENSIQEQSKPTTAEKLCSS